MLSKLNEVHNIVHLDYQRITCNSDEKIQKQKKNTPKIRVWYLFMLKFSASVLIRYFMVPNNRGELLLIVM